MRYLRFPLLSLTILLVLVAFATAAEETAEDLARRADEKLEALLGS